MWGACRLSQAGLEERVGLSEITLERGEGLHSDVILGGSGGGVWEIMGRHLPTPRLLEGPGTAAHEETVRRASSY